MPGRSSRATEPRGPPRTGSADAPYDPRLELHGAGRLVVYVPGLDGTGRLFYRQIPHFSEAGFCVATYRLRDEATRFDVFVADLDRVIVDARERAVGGDDAGVRSQEAGAAGAGDAVTLVGESFGGALAMSYALAHPGRVARLVIVNSFARFERRARLALGIAGLGAIGWGGLAVVRSLMVSRIHSPVTPRSEVRRFLRLTDEASPRGFANRLRALRTYDLRDGVSGIVAPTLFVAADRDRVVPSLAEARRMHRALPGSHVEVLSGHGHACLVAPGVNLATMMLRWQREGAA